MNYWEINIDRRGLDGVAKPVRKKAKIQTRRGAEREEREIRQAIAEGTYDQVREEAPTFEDWFNGRFWTEWVIGERNKPAEQESKRSIYKCHLKDRFGDLRLDEIAGGSHIPQFKAALMGSVNEGKLAMKSVNNILAVLSKALRYAEEAQIIDRAPRVKLYRLERPEMEWWELEEYPRILAAAREEGPEWYAAVCLAGEAGLRIGEVRALRWERDIDLVAGTLTVSEQTRKGITGTPKGRTRRKVPTTATLIDAIKALAVVRRGYVVRNPDGSQVRDGQTTHAIYRVCRRAGLPERGWHALRHTFGTHAAMFGANPWRLMGWMGHKTITETMRYVHVAEDHMRPMPDAITDAAVGEADLDRRIVRMLSARRTRAEHGAENVDSAEVTEGSKMREPSAIH